MIIQRVRKFPSKEFSDLDVRFKKSTKFRYSMLTKHQVSNENSRRSQHIPLPHTHTRNRFLTRIYHWCDNDSIIGGNRRCQRFGCKMSSRHSWILFNVLTLSMLFAGTVYGVKPVSENDIAGEPVVGFPDTTCSSERSKTFGSYQELKEHDGTSDQNNVVWYFGSFHTIENPETCYQLRSQNMETIVVVGERIVEELPNKFTVYTIEQARSILRANIRAYQKAVEKFNQCWQNALEISRRNEYRFVVVENLSDNRLAQTIHGDIKEIRIGLSQIRSHAYNERSNFWHLLMQTAIHEWVHVEQRRRLEAADQWWMASLPWFRVELERQAQKRAHDLYIQVYNRNPPQAYLEVPSGTEWEEKKRKYNKLIGKKVEGEQLSEKEMTELRELERIFKELEDTPAPFNEGNYVYNHFDLCG